jgi:hypothetical protein
MAFDEANREPRGIQLQIIPNLIATVSHDDHEAFEALLHEA